MIATVFDCVRFGVVIVVVQRVIWSRFRVMESSSSCWTPPPSLNRGTSWVL